MRWGRGQVVNPGSWPTWCCRALQSWSMVSCAGWVQWTSTHQVRAQSKFLLSHMPYCGRPCHVLQCLGIAMQYNIDGHYC